MLGARAACGCEWSLPDLESIHAPLEYAGPVRELVHRFKYDGMHGAGGWMSGRMEPLCPPDATALVPVPLHPKRERDRGFNQAEVLARPIARKHRVPLIRALKRTRMTTPQVELTAEERWANVRELYTPARGHELRGLVVVVDDVCTTGATLQECARQLRAMGAERVVGLVFART
ncbi:MAG: ComF family protein [Chloroflexota bacterium]|nr:ComF family protein [Chloroflexota bacterium]